MRRIIAFFLCLLTVLFLLAGCGNRAQDQEEDAQTDEEGIDHGEEEIPANPLQPPDLPPEGMRYDEWKGFTYTKDMELKSLKKKYKSKGFAAGCSRDVIERGADQLGWELDKLLEMTLQAMADSEDIINKELEEEQV